MNAINFRKILLSGIIIFFLFLEAGSLGAMTVSNDSGSKIAVGILWPMGGQDRPVFFKILDPRNSLDFKPEQKGPFIVSVANLDTKATTRIEGVNAQDRVLFDGKDLKKK
ncbi:MAG TPA: hypothetical protein PKL97_08505 [Candidatus Omnitrophota bacterium]|nr:hypothetical protein [Candidatus Omnitrophota bacterium]